MDRGSLNFLGCKVYKVVKDFFPPQNYTNKRAPIPKSRIMKRNMTRSLLRVYKCKPQPLQV